MNLVSILLLGLGILAGAIVLNMLAAAVGLMNWYEFLAAPNRASALSLLWLFFIYPFALGLIAYYLTQLGQ